MGLLYIEGLLAAAVVCYAHRAIPRFTATAARRGAAHRRAWRAAADWLRIRHCYSPTPGLAVPRWLALVMGFGAVHVPAAAILLVKYLRGSGRS